MSRQVKNPITGWWEKIPEPRWTSMAWTFAYVMLVLAGLSLLLDPPTFFSKGMGGVLTVYWAILLVLGGSLGAFAAPTGWHIIERFSILVIGVAMSMYAVAVATLAIVIQHNISYQVFLNAAFLLVVAGRWFQVRHGVRDPEVFSTYAPKSI